MKFLILLLFIVTCINSVKADCLSCWELRKVEIKLTDGEQLVGFVYWNEAWLTGNLKNWKDWANKFPESFIELHRTSPERKVILISKLTELKNDSLPHIKVTVKENIYEFYINQISEIKELDKELEKYQGAGEIPIYTLETIQILNSNPVAVYQTDISVADIYFLSYNSNINKSDLEEISKGQYFGKEAELRKRGVLFVAINYD